MKAGTPDHPKTRDLAEALGGEYTAIAVLELLFLATAKYASRGDLGKFSDARIEQLLRWPGEPGVLVAALRHGWLDPHPLHRIVTHDWPEHAPTYVKRSIRERGCGWAVDDAPSQSLGDTGGETPSVGHGGSSRGEPPENDGTQGVRHRGSDTDLNVCPSLPNRTVPNLSSPYRTAREAPGGVTTRQAIGDVVHEIESGAGGNGGSLSRPHGDGDGGYGQNGEAPESTAAKVLAMKDRLGDCSPDSRNLEKIAERMSWESIDQAMLDAHAARVDGQTDNEARYFVGIMKRMAREQGIGLRLGRA